MTAEEAPFQYKMLTTDSTPLQTANQPVKRTLQVVSPEQMTDKKRPRILLARDETQNRTVVLHTNSTSPIKTVPGRSILKPAVSVVNSTSNIASSPQTTSAVTSITNAATAIQTPSITSGVTTIQAAPGPQYIIRMGNQGNIQQPQQVLINGQPHLLHNNIATPIVVQSQDKVKADEPAMEADMMEAVTPDTNITDMTPHVTETTDVTQLTHDVTAHAQEETDIQGIETPAEGAQMMEQSELQQLDQYSAISAKPEEEQGGSDVETQEGQIVVGGDSDTQIYLQQGQDGEQQIIEGANIYQTEDGLILIENADGTFQIHGNGDQPIPLETVQALLGMDGDQVLQVQEAGDQAGDQADLQHVS